MDNLEMRERLGRVYSALQEKGYHPLNQICGYILTEDPTYITNRDHPKFCVNLHCGVE